MLYILSIILFIVYQSENSDFYTDTYMMFDRVMFLDLSNYFQSNPSYLNRKCNVIYNHYLKEVDIDLYIYLNKHNIEVNMVFVYFINRKWLRCVFAREFFFEEVLELWDAVLRHYNASGFYMMDFIALSMMIWTRDCGILYSVYGDSNEILPRINGYCFKGKAKVILKVADQCRKYIMLGQYNCRVILPRLFD